MFEILLVENLGWIILSQDFVAGHNQRNLCVKYTVSTSILYVISILL